MASEQNSLGPAFNRLDLFAPLFDDTIVNRLSEVSPISAAHLDHHQVPDSPHKQQQLLGETVLQLHLQQQQNKPCPTHDNQLKTPYLNQFHKPQSMTQRRSLIRLHRLNSFLTLLSRLHAIWILLTCEIITNITLRHNIGIKWNWKNKLDAEGTMIRNKSCLVTKGYSQ